MYMTSSCLSFQSLRGGMSLSSPIFLARSGSAAFRISSSKGIPANFCAWK